MYSLWRNHPAVRTGSQLSFGERAADWLKHWFGTWTALGIVGAWIAFWIVLQNFHSTRFDSFPYILLNLCLSCLAAVQGIILQISANRGDRINSELAAHDYEVNQKALSRIEVLISKVEAVERRLDGADQ